MSACISVQGITFEQSKLATSFLVYRYIFAISRSSLSTNVIASRSRSNENISCKGHTNLNHKNTYLKGCDLCVTQMVHLRLKSILVGYTISNSNQLNASGFQNNNF